MTSAVLNLSRNSIKLKNFNNLFTNRHFSVTLMPRLHEHHRQDNHHQRDNEKANTYTVNKQKEQFSFSQFQHFFSATLKGKLKINDLNETFTHFEEHQNKVNETKNKLMVAHDLRRKTSTDLFNIQQEIDIVQNEISKLAKFDDKIINFHEKLIDLQRIKEKALHDFRSYEENERFLLTLFISSMHISMEKQNNYRLAVLFWSKIFGVIWAVLTIGATMIGYQYNSQIPHVVVSLQELRKEIQEVQQKPEGWGSYISRHSSNVYRYFIPK